eukprot:TRINITY_DN2784_c0_g1_i2.p1 TRINITY_DN2784_c0_g1~~TRINITY_DN2784_c0_g1_i2.p1  ORF type:complete len:224 (-),score=43.11 TRINITY_DN2784_c0_g1_i2:26-697(-)
MCGSHSVLLSLLLMLLFLSLIGLRCDYTCRITAMPARHGPAVFHHALPETMGSMVEFSNLTTGQHLYRIYISGDTMVFDELKHIPERFGGIDLALVHLGGTSALGVLVTMTPQQGIEALQIVRPKEAIPIHYDDYDKFKHPLGAEPHEDYHTHGSHTHAHDHGTDGDQHHEGRVCADHKDDTGRIWTTFEEFARAAQEAVPGMHVTILKRGETYRFQTHSAAL